MRIVGKIAGMVAVFVVAFPLGALFAQVVGGFWYGFYLGLFGL